MFTGLIEAVCSVRSVRRLGAALKLTIDLGQLAQDTGISDSIAVNGACLTVSALTGSAADFEVSEETMKKTTLSNLRLNDKVNVERAIKADSRFGGHFVQGHVDATAKIKAIEKKGDFAQITFQAEKQLIDQLIPKGSIAVDGISLTIARLSRDTFTVAIIPDTLKKTNLQYAKPADLVNIEIDMITKTIRKQLEKILPGKIGLTVEKLKEIGF